MDLTTILKKLGPTRSSAIVAELQSLGLSDTAARWQLGNCQFSYYRYIDMPYSSYDNGCIKLFNNRNNRNQP